MKGSSIFFLIFAILIFAPNLEASTATVQGTVVDADNGEPIIEGDADLFIGTVTIQTTALMAGGMYQFTNVAPEYVLVRFSAPKKKTEVMGTTPVGGQTSTVNGALSDNPATIIGQVVDTTMTGISNATVNAVQGGIVVVTIITDPSGNYELDGLSQGSYTVVAMATSFQSSTATTTVQDNTTTTINLTLDSNPGTVTGTVTDTSITPISGAQVQVFSENTLIATTFTSAAGLYSIANLSPGSYTLQVSSSGTQLLVTSVTITSSMTTTQNVTLQSTPATISGTVTDAFTGAPLSGAVINLYQAGVLIVSFVTDSSGNYAFNQAAAGAYSITASNQGYSSSSASTSVVASGMATQNFQLVNQNGAPTGLQGEVVIDQFLFQDDRTHQLQWNPNPGAVSYNIYRYSLIATVPASNTPEYILIATVPASSPLEYIDHNRSKKVTDYYQVTGVDANGNEGPPASIALR